MNARKHMTQLFMRAYNPDLSGSSFLSATPTEMRFLGKDGRMYLATRNAEGQILAYYRQLTQREAASFGFETP